MKPVQYVDRWFAPRALKLLSAGIYLPMLGGCAPGGSADQIQQINATLSRQSEAWNRGDIEAFMEPYEKSDELTFSASGTTTSGWQATLDRYRQRYPTADDMGQLTFNELHVRLLEKRHALVLGKWHLERDDPVGGNFSLVMARENGRWVIIHDHTSNLATDR